MILNFIGKCVEAIGTDFIFRRIRKYRIENEGRSYSAFQSLKYRFVILYIGRIKLDCEATNSSSCDGLNLVLYLQHCSDCCGVTSISEDELALRWILSSLILSPIRFASKGNGISDSKISTNCSLSFHNLVYV